MEYLSAGFKYAGSALSYLSAFLTMHKDALVAVTWIIAGTNWIVTNRQANQREVRKETRTEVDAICKVAAETLTNIRKYYSFPARDPEDDLRSSEIDFDIKRILTRTETLDDRRKCFSSARKAAGDLWENVTDDPFKSKTRRIFLPADLLIKELEDKVHTLIDELETGFSAKFS